MRTRCWLGGLFLISLCSIGCEANERTLPADPPEKPSEKPVEKPKEPVKPVESKKTAFNKSGTLQLETFADGRRRVWLEASVCFREGPLELLLCRKETKEHEAILHADVNAQDIHTVLMIAKAKPGSPVKYEESRILPPTGTTIKITLQYEKKPGELITVDAKEWIRNLKTRRALERDWVFAGSALWKDEDDPKRPPYYLANNGNVVSIANFNDAMLDLPFASSKESAELAFECWTERIPPLKTKVMVIFEPVFEDKKSKP